MALAVIGMNEIIFLLSHGEVEQQEDRNLKCAFHVLAQILILPHHPKKAKTPRNINEVT